MESTLEGCILSDAASCSKLRPVSPKHLPAIDFVWHPDKLIRTNLITGFLGTGKTTAILDLLNYRPEGERWSVFVNEYGMVSIDELMFDEQTPEIQIQELAGGCFCCTTAGMMDTMLLQFIRRTKPDRLLIEPSGAGHPARVIDVLRSQRFRSILDLRATICLVDPKDFDNPRVTNSEVFYDQIQMSDVIAINWLDKRESGQILRCRQWIDQFDPPKLLVAETQFGKLKPEWLDLDGIVMRPPRFADAHAVHAHAVGEPHAAILMEPVIVPSTQSAMPGQPLRLENAGNGQRACGWIFSSAEVFDRATLFDFLAAIPSVQRIKGIFHCSDDWWLVNRTGHDVSVSRTAYRRDSRVEVITDNELLNWARLEAEMTAYLDSE